VKNSASTEVIHRIFAEKLDNLDRIHSILNLASAFDISGTIAGVKPYRALGDYRFITGNKNTGTIQIMNRAVFQLRSSYSIFGVGSDFR